MKTILRLLTFTILLASLSVTGQARPALAEQGQHKEGTKRVELYVTDWCGYCKKAEAFLIRNNISYTKYDVEKDSAANERKYRLGGGRGVPFALIDGKPVSGFSQQAYETLLGLKK